MFTRASTRHLSLHNNGRGNNQQRPALWNLQSAARFAQCVPVSVAKQEVQHTVDERTLSCLPLSIGEDIWSLSCLFTSTSTTATTSALPSIFLPPWAGGESLRGPLDVTYARHPPVDPASCLGALQLAPCDAGGIPAACKDD